MAPTTRTDEQIQKDVLDELTWDARVRPNEIGVTVSDGVVALTGWVDSHTKKWAAEEAAHRVRGALAVANDIEIHLPSSAERTDADIAAAAVRALEWDTFVPIEQIDVTVSKGWVILKGEVEWQSEAGCGTGGAPPLRCHRSDQLDSGQDRWSPPSSSKRFSRNSRSAELDGECIQVKAERSKVVQGDGALMGGETRSGADGVVRAGRPRPTTASRSRLSLYRDRPRESCALFCSVSLFWHIEG